MKFHAACWSIVLGACSSLGTLMPPASANPPSGGTAQRSDPDASGLSPKQRWWRKVQEDSANAKGEWDSNGHADDGHMKRSHDQFAKSCGHDLKVAFDWKSFDMNHWIEVQQAQHMPDNMVAGYCTYETISELASACEADSPLKSYQRDAIKKLTTLTCHARACKDMPDTNTGEPGRQDAMTFAVFAIGDGGSNLDMTYCESNANGSMVVNTWMRSL
ncbi:MAG TPA: hypothetical protein VGF94_21610 [Kofleriaceae bacterium]|jgi:hypothetical protein